MNNKTSRSKKFHHSEETKKKISLAIKGRKHTLESKQKMSKTRKGKKPYIMTDKIRANMSKARKGVKHSEEHKKKISLALMGSKNPFFGEKHSKETRKKLSIMKTIHGLRGRSPSRFYRIWRGIQTRCRNIKSPAYKYYGAKGVVCLWKNFLDFKNDMYESYLLHVQKFGEKQTQVDRINNDKGYYKKNCRWVTLSEQARNKRSYLKNHESRQK